MPRIRCILLRLNHSELELQAFLEENRDGEEPAYDEANDRYDWTRVDPDQLERADEVIEALKRIARTGLEREFPGAAVDVECSADTPTGLEVEPEAAEELVQTLVDAQLATWIEQAWAAARDNEGGASGGDAA